MSDFIWWIGAFALIYYFAKFSTWVMRKLIFAGDEKKFRHCLEEKNEGAKE